MYISMLAAGYDMKKEERDGAPMTEEEAIEEASVSRSSISFPTFCMSTSQKRMVLRFPRRSTRRCWPMRQREWDCPWRKPTDSHTRSRVAM